MFTSLFAQHLFLILQVLACVLGELGYRTPQCNVQHPSYSSLTPNAGKFAMLFSKRGKQGTVAEKCLHKDLGAE